MATVEAANRHFSVVDWIVFVALLLFSASVGIYHGCKNKNKKDTADYLMGGRRLNLLPTAISILVSFQSAILLLGAPAEIYTKGTQYYLYTFGQISAVIVSAFVFVPFFYRLQLTSVNEYLLRRFNSKATQLTSTVITILSTLIYSGLASFAPATALNAVSGFPEWASFLLIGSVCTFYTLLGGLRSVIWVDAFQFFIMIAGLLAIVIQATIAVGGMSNLWKSNEQWDRIHFWNFDPDPTVRHTFWGLTIGAMLNWVGTYGVSQGAVQRYSALKSLKHAKIAVLLNAVGVFVLITLASLSGLSVFAYYANAGCDPFTNNNMKNKNQLIPYFVMEALNYPGLPGIFIASLFSGALSTLSTNLSSISTVTWEDFLKPFFAKKSPSIGTLVTRIVVLCYGIIGIGVTFIVSHMKGSVLQASLSFMGAASGSLNGLFYLGIFFPSCNWIGAIAGTVISYIIIMWLGIAKYTVVGVSETLAFPTANCPVQNITETMSLYHSNVTYLSEAASSAFTPSSTVMHTMMTSTLQTTEHPKSLSGLAHFYLLSYLWYATLGSLIAIVVGLVTSYLTGATKKENVNPKLIIPVVAKVKKAFHSLCSHHRKDKYKTQQKNVDNDSAMVVFKDSS